jgi:hypothetical protein
LRKVGNTADPERATASRNNVVPDRDAKLIRRVATPRPIDVFVGDRLRELRETRAMALSEVGDAVGIPQGRLASYEGGELRVPPGDLIALAELFDVELAALFPRTNAHAPPLY